MKAIAHCRVAIFHDTGNWFVDVPRLIYEIADRFNLPHFHFPHHEGSEFAPTLPTRKFMESDSPANAMSLCSTDSRSS
jgi:hypothetical protein